MAWTPDSKAIVFWAGGKIRRVDADGGGARGDPVPRRRHPRGDRRDRIRRSRSRPTAFADQDAALGQRLARRPPGGVRDARQAVDQARRGRRRAAADQGRRGGVRAVPELVARRPDDRLRRLDRRGPRPDPHRRGGRRRGRATSPAQPGHYRPPALLARRQDDRVRAGAGRLPDLRALVAKIPASTGSPRRAARRSGSPSDGAEPQFGAAQRPRVHDRAATRASASWSAPTSTARRKRVHATGELVNDYQVSPDGRLCRLPPELSRRS